MALMHSEALAYLEFSDDNCRLQSTATQFSISKFRLKVYISIFIFGVSIVLKSVMFLSTVSI